MSRTVPDARQKALKATLIARRLREMRREERSSIKTARTLQSRSRPRLFNLDLHIGVIADLERECRAQHADLTRWSISAHNHLVEDRLPITDPVRHVNSRSWRRMDPRLIDRFQDRYSRWLKTFDGFVCTYSPTFAELFDGLGKPTLIVAATRYEVPYSGQPEQWTRFDEFLSAGVRAGSIHLYANNRGDADYVTLRTGIEIPVTPSLCEREPRAWTGQSGRRVVIARDPHLVAEIDLTTGGAFTDISVLGRPYRWEDLLACEEVFVLPQNISTMTLFELATAGVPVAVPDRQWLRALRSSGRAALAELTFHELDKLPVPQDASVAVNYRASEYLDWWMDRADFFDPELMPNVRTVSSIAELRTGASVAVPQDADYRQRVRMRNERIRDLRQDMVRKFLAAL